MITIGKSEIDMFGQYLNEQEYSAATIRKYLYDVSVLSAYSSGEIRDRVHLNGFRKYLEEEKYSSRSVNSMLGAVNKFLSFLGLDWKLRYEKVQRQNFLPESRKLSTKEYEQLVRKALELGNTRLAMLLQSICALGIRVSEVQAITVESLGRGEAFIRNKGKVRTILIPKNLADKLADYCAAKGISSGCIFVTRSGKPLDRSNIWKMMKRLAELAGVEKKKAYPHSLRHLFARTYYQKFHNIVRLADILGHSSIDTTRIYTTHDGQEERRQMNQLALLI